MQVKNGTQFGFSLCSDVHSWPGGIGSGFSIWEVVDESEVPDEAKERLGPVLEKNK